MKKLILLGLIILNLSSYAQRPKSITFVDSVMIKNQNNGPMSFFAPFQAVDLGDEGYFISNIYDDFSQGLKFLIMKLDVEGTLQFDTIYNVSTEFSNNILYDSKKFGSKSLFLSIDKKYQPFVYALDNSNGNFSWSYIYNIDTSFASFEPTGITVNKAGNEALIYGSSSKSVLQSILNTSFVIKLDSNGNELWTKDIGYSIPDTNFISIRSAAPTKDNGYIMASEASSDLYSNNFINLIKLDSSGNKVWENNFDIVNQSGQDTIMPKYYKRIKKVITFDDGTASLVGMYTNTNERGQIFVVNFNQASGAINSATKNYNPSESIILTNAVKDQAYNGIAINYNGRNSKLAKFDKVGRFISARRVIEYPLKPSKNWNDVFINTLDNGFLTVKKNDSINNEQGYLITKLNKKLYSSCVDTIHKSLISKKIKTTPINLTLKLISQTTAKKSVSKIGNSGSKIFFGNQCKCKLLISGRVKDTQNNFIDSVKIELYKVNTSGAFTLFDSTITSGNGEYIFDYLPEDSFIVKAITNIPNTVNTYYGEPNDQAVWDSAYVFNLNCANSSLTRNDITLLPTVPQSGNGVLKGFVFELKGFDNNLSKGQFGENKHRFEKALGDPIPGIDITLNQQLGGAVGTQSTNSNGAYQFTGLNVGSSYTLRADIPGLPNDSVYSIDIKAGKTNYDSLNFYVDSVGVYIIKSGTNGIEVFNENNLKISLAPNPTSNKVNLVFKTIRNNEAVVKVLNNTGALLIEKQKQLNKGDSTVELDLSLLTNGIYFIQIQLENNVIVKKVIKQ